MKSQNCHKNELYKMTLCSIVSKIKNNWIKQKNMCNPCLCKFNKRKNRFIIYLLSQPSGDITMGKSSLDTLYIHTGKFVGIKYEVLYYYVN